MLRAPQRSILSGTALLAVALALPTPGAGAAPAATRGAAPTSVVGKISVDVGSEGVALTPAAVRIGHAAAGARASDTDVLAAYWTPERMRKATPASADPALRSSERAFVARMKRLERRGLQPVTNDGPPQAVPGVAGKVSAPASEAASGTERTTPSADNPNVPYYTPTAYTQGKVFFTKPGVGNFVCSGTIVNSEGKDTVWTAGHCVHGGQGGTWHANWTFVPAYDDDLANPRPYGTWSANQLWSKSSWTGSSDYSQDMGVAIMNPLNGSHIVDYFGGQGLTTNRGKSVYERAFGYPSEAPFDGGNLYRCQGTTSPEWDAWFTWSQTVKIGCDMTRGSSGGGWLYGYNGSWGQLNGLNSRIDRIVGPTIMLSPYFDDDAWNLYNTTRNL